VQRRAERSECTRVRVTQSGVADAESHRLAAMAQRRARVRDDRWRRAKRGESARARTRPGAALAAAVADSTFVGNGFNAYKWRVGDDAAAVGDTTARCASATSGASPRDAAVAAIPDGVMSHADTDAAAALLDGTHGSHAACVNVHHHYHSSKSASHSSKSASHSSKSASYSSKSASHASKSASHSSKSASRRGGDASGRYSDSERDSDSDGSDIVAFDPGDETTPHDALPLSVAATPRFRLYNARGDRRRVSTAAPTYGLESSAAASSSFYGYERPNEDGHYGDGFVDSFCMSRLEANPDRPELI
jgi:hypothetical protein